MLNKRGQFFLIAALVIIVIIIGFAAFYNVAETPPEDIVIYDLSKEINFEAGEVIDSGIFNALTTDDWHKNLENLTDYYAKANLGNDFFIVYGNRSRMFILAYTTKNTGSVSVGASTIDTTEVRRVNVSFAPSADEGTVTLVIPKENLNITNTFNIKPGQTFYAIIQKERLGERYVVASKSDADSESA